MNNTETICSFSIEVSPSIVNILQAVFESYEGLAAVRTEDPKKGLVAFYTSPANIPVVMAILEKEFKYEFR